METLTIISLGKCPNCDNPEFNINTRTCPKCGYSLEHTNMKVKKYLVKNFTGKKRIYINYKDYTSYEILIDEKNTGYVKFKKKYNGKNYKFVVYFEIKNNGFIEITGIQEKAKVGYKELKYSPNYFRFRGINFYDILIFLRKIRGQV